jgi:hypothetical protein
LTTEEAVQRGNNLVGVAISALSGVAFFPEFFLESEAPFKLDETGLFLIGLAGVAWYLTGAHKLRRSLVPLALVAADFVFKVIGLVIESGDKEDVGDEYGALILFALATILVGWLYFSGRSTAERSAS